ncbi:Auxin-induced protein 10A5 [Hibiscus syriacus]|uniref:Auxin-induced protein 10A5 n=2 Tax=Hibiscus syriacus TaxID=106335 RepID=A0A6A2XV73_HIBSY|nr:Auxin-induced protein 10A5 [Hibiscus syriacus]
MDDQGESKSGIRQFIKLKEILQKWQPVTLCSMPETDTPHSGENHGFSSPAVNRSLKDIMRYDSDEDSSHGPEPPADVPKGYLAVYVGQELRRFIIPTSYLSHPVFTILLEKAEEEFGYDHNGGLTLPCEIETFKYLLKCIENHPKDRPVDSSVPKQAFTLHRHSNFQPHYSPNFQLIQNFLLIVAAADSLDSWG